MPAGRAVLLLRRLSTGDSRLKNINLNQSTLKEPPNVHPVCGHRDLGLGSIKRFSSFSQNNISKPPLIRSVSDSTIMMSANPDGEAGKPKHTNALIFAKSPYLLQHAHNPVQWFSWGQEAFDKAQKENKMIFLSVGYSTCHWCHVMEKESFEDEDIAKVMNDNFVNIKVDREERPDIDRLYMLFVMASTGQGGWPMSIFLTPDLCPVTGGTYFPPEDRWGRMGFKSILLSVANSWKNRKDDFIQTGASVLEAMQKVSFIKKSKAIPSELTWEQCVRKYKTMYEPDFGGFGSKPKFPQGSIFNFLFHYYARDKLHPEGKRCLTMACFTLMKIAKGGIHDHIGGGFSRYSVDNEWHVPHFEKMLYDQAQLIVAYTDAFLATQDDFYSDVIHDIIKYANRDLRHETGGYYSAEDADSYPEHGAALKVEGAFYVWDYNEIKDLLVEKRLEEEEVYHFEVFCTHYGIEEKGNITPEKDPHEELKNKNVLIIYTSNEDTAEEYCISTEQLDRILTECHTTLYEARMKRPRPHLDSKMLCSWNGLMICALARAGQALSNREYIDDALKTAKFIKEHLYDPASKTLLHSCYRDDDGCISQIEQPIKGFLDDYAFLIRGLLDLYEACFDEEWLQLARDLQETQDQLFWDNEDGAYFTSPAEDNNMPLRLKDEHDGAEPCGNSVSCHNLQRLAAYANKAATGEGSSSERARAERLLLAYAKKLQSSPTAMPEMMSALMFFNDSPTQVLIAGGSADPRTLELVRAVRSRLLPGRVLCIADPADSAAGLSDRSEGETSEDPAVLNRVKAVGGVPTAYVCRRYACSLPVTDVKDLETILDEPTRAQD